MKIPKLCNRDKVKEWFERRGISHSPKEIQMVSEKFQEIYDMGWRDALASQQNIRVESMKGR